MISDTVCETDVSAEVRGLAWLEPAARARVTAGLHRELRPRTAVDRTGNARTGDARTIDARTIDVASNDYLGLATDPRVTRAAADAALRWGAGSTGSRLVTGTTAEHQDLEEELAQFVGAPAALVFASGYAANLAVLSALGGPNALIVSDRASHASIVDGCRLSRSRVVVTPHSDVDAVEAVLADRAEQRALVVTDSVFSADGDLAPLARLYEVARRHGAVLVVDEAHGIGVRGRGGRGLVEEVGLAGAPDLVVTGTLSKALGSQGGVVFGSAALRAHLIDTARTFIFDTGLAPAAVAAARAALAILREEPVLAGRVLDRAARLAASAGVPPPPSAVVSVVLGAADTAVAAAARCAELGVWVGCFRPPSVPVGTARLRLTARADLTEAELATIGRVLAEVLGHPDRLTGPAA